MIVDVYYIIKTSKGHWFPNFQHMTFNIKNVNHEKIVQLDVFVNYN